MTLRALPLLIITSVLAACGGSSPGASAGGGAGAPSAPASQAAPDQGEQGSATVTVASGPDAGTYEVAPIVDCNTSTTGGGFAGGDVEATEGITGLIIVTLSDATELTDQGFAVQVIFNDNDYQVGSYSDENFEGTGTLRFGASGDTLTVAFQGTTDDGVGLAVNGSCRPVDRR